jgi:amidohydrolase
MIAKQTLTRRHLLAGSSVLAFSALAPGRAMAAPFDPFAALVSRGPSSLDVPAIGATASASGAPYLAPVADGWRIVVHGRQGHGAMPANTVDPIVVSAEIVTALQTIVSRQLDLSKAPAVVTVGAIHGGLRENIIPDSVWMIGTIRAFDPDARKTIRDRMKRIATNIAEAHGATADVIVDIGYPSSVNSDAMVAKFYPTLKRVAGAAGAMEGDVTMAGEDFSRFSELAPGFFFNLSVTPPNLDPKTVASNHSPLFQGDDRALAVGVRAMTNMAMDFLRSGGAPKPIP